MLYSTNIPDTTCWPSVSVRVMTKVTEIWESFLKLQSQMSRMLFIGTQCSNSSSECLWCSQRVRATPKIHPVRLTNAAWVTGGHWPLDQAEFNKEHTSLNRQQQYYVIKHHLINKPKG